MFWENFSHLCEERGETPSGVARAIGISPAATTKWKQGTLPSAEVLINIATHFDVSIDSLLGHTSGGEENKQIKAEIVTIRPPEQRYYSGMLPLSKRRNRVLAQKGSRVRTMSRAAKPGMRQGIRPGMIKKGVKND